MLHLFLLSAVLSGTLGFTPVDKVKVTGYCPGPPCVAQKWADGITAAGTKARRGVCAADWKVFPKGSLFLIPGYGKCRVEDTGNEVKGKHLDLYFDTEEEAIQWGVTHLRVYHLGWSNID